MSVWIVSNLDEVSSKIDPKEFEKQNISRLTFKEFKFVNPREESLPKILKDFSRDNLYIKLSLRKGKSFDTANIILVGGSISSLTFESGGRRVRGSLALVELGKRFPQYQSGVMEIYVIEESLAKNISYISGLPKKLSDKELETLEVKAPPPEEVEVVEEREEVEKPLALEDVKGEVENALVEVCNAYNYKLDGYKFIELKDYLVLEVKTSTSLFRKAKVSREDLTRELWSKIRPIVGKCGFEKFKLRVRYGLLTFEHP